AVSLPEHVHLLCGPRVHHPKADAHPVVALGGEPRRVSAAFSSVIDGTHLDAIDVDPERADASDWRLVGSSGGQSPEGLGIGVDRARRGIARVLGTRPIVGGAL